MDWASLMTKTVTPPFVPQTSSLPLNFDERYMKRTPIDRRELALNSFGLSSNPLAAPSRRRSFQRLRCPLPLLKILHTCNAARPLLSFLCGHTYPSCLRPRSPMRWSAKAARVRAARRLLEKTCPPRAIWRRRKTKTAAVMTVKACSNWTRRARTMHCVNILCSEAMTPLIQS